MLLNRAALTFPTAARSPFAARRLKVAMSAAAKAITVVAAAAEHGFQPFRACPATRLPAMPEEGDMADDTFIITDPRSGLSFELALYKQYKRVKYELGIAWGVKNAKVAHGPVARLISSYGAQKLGAGLKRPPHFF